MEGYPYIEVATSGHEKGSFRRNMCLPAERLSELIKTANSTQTLYRSHWLYPEAFKQHLIKHQSVKGYDGPAAIDHVIVDIDMANNAQRMAFIDKLKDFWYDYVLAFGLESYILASFSGNGFHLYIHQSAFEIDPAPNVYEHVGLTIRNWWDQEAQKFFKGFTYDPAMYEQLRVYRLPGTINHKTGYRKILFDPISTDLQTLAIASAKAQHLIDKKTLLDWKENHVQADGFMMEYHELPTKTNVVKAQAPSSSQQHPFVGHCFHEIMKMGAQAKELHGGRHPLVLRLASYFYFQSMPYEAAFHAIHRWCEDSFKQYDVEDTTQCIKSIYAGEYRYGCMDPILRQHCNSKCRFYKNRFKEGYEKTSDEVASKHEAPSSAD